MNGRRPRPVAAGLFRTDREVRGLFNYVESKRGATDVLCVLVQELINLIYSFIHSFINFKVVGPTMTI